MQIPIFEYDYSGEKFKNVQIMSCVEISKLKLSIREKMDMKNLLVGAKERLEIEKALSKYGPDTISSTMDESVELEKLATNNSKNNAPKIDITRGNTSKIENINNSPKIDGIKKTNSIHQTSKKQEMNPNTVNEDELVDKRNFVREIFRNMIVDEIPVTTVPTREEFDMHIKIKSGEKPIKRNCGRRSPEQHKAVIEEAARLMKLGIIEESVSEYSAIPFFAKDHTGKKRFVIDYRALNEQTVKHEKSRHYTAFRVGNKLYQFKRCAFGLKNSPAYFNRWIQSMLGEYENFALAYVDDVVIFSNSLEEHIEHLKLVLLKLQMNSVYLSNHKLLPDQREHQRNAGYKSYDLEYFNSISLETSHHPIGIFSSRKFVKNQLGDIGLRVDLDYNIMVNNSTKHVIKSSRNGLIISPDSIKGPVINAKEQKKGVSSILELTSLDDTTSQVCLVRHLATYLRASKGRRKTRSCDSPGQWSKKIEKSKVYYNTLMIFLFIQNWAISYISSKSLECFYIVKRKSEMIKNEFDFLGFQIHKCISGDTLKIMPKITTTFPKNLKRKTRKHFLMNHSKNSCENIVDILIERHYSTPIDVEKVKATTDIPIHSDTYNLNNCSFHLYCNVRDKELSLSNIW
ncbi:hypothetical protein ACTFIR_003902 [Dictyostelium discoideum]